MRLIKLNLNPVTVQMTEFYIIEFMHKFTIKIPLLWATPTGPRVIVLPTTPYLSTKKANQLTTGSTYYATMEVLHPV